MDHTENVERLTLVFLEAIIEFLLGSFPKITHVDTFHLDNKHSPRVYGDPQSSLDVRRQTFLVIGLCRRPFFVERIVTIVFE